ncbi:hypothetical protein ZOSMA_1024G00010 [Zostera marina]|uniref:Niemann-Pick C1 N-terminal domain-containing protein n=1 Tax=Zostera marina TaxID=29655 RepID=A0A0K9Q564_ZOSMR|nr:hypothetical protein ZOSMA_1024G00010 [Zostera marina]
MESSYRSWRSHVSASIFVLQVFIFICLFISQKTKSQSDDISGKKYEEGYCSMYDICGHRSDGKVLNCPNVTHSIKPNNMLSLKIQSLCPTINGNVCCTEEQFNTLRGQVQQAIPFLGGCPACLRNFLNLFCEITCSPNQSLFINVNKIRTVDGIEYFITEYFAKELYNSCKDVKFGSLNSRAMNYIGAGARNYKGDCKIILYYII